LDYRLVASPRATALRSFLVCLSAGALLSCAKANNTTGSGGSTGSGSGGSNASGGSTGSGGNNNSGGNTGSGGSSSSGGNSASGGNGSGGSVSSGGNTGSGGSPNSGGNTGSGGAPSSGGSTGSGGSSTVSDAGADASCQTADFKFVPQIPTVYLLVDRSGSMFHCLTGNTGDAVCSDMTNTSWYNLKMAIESVMATLDSQVRFGFTTVYGTNPSGGGTCPSLQGMLTNNVAPALNNAATIKTLYDGLAFPPNSTQVGIKFESPASESIGNVANALAADTTPGGKFIIFLTDGQPDYCDDSNSLCAPDSVVYHLQKAYAAGIKTIVFGVQTSLFDLAPGALQSFANAGAGEATLAPVKTGGTANDFYDQCSGVAGWAADLTATGQTSMRGDTLGTYSTTMGPTMPYTPSASNESQLVSQLTAALSGVKSCSFDLSDVGGKSIKVDTTKLSSAVIKIGATTIPLDPTNGWNVTASAPTTLVLSGTACATWQTPNNNDISFMFPCSTIIFE
jgi:hypothetical protein